MFVGGEPGVDSYFDLVDLWIRRLLEGFQTADSRSAHGRHEAAGHHQEQHH
jgi:hypothetical protein